MKKKEKSPMRSVFLGGAIVFFVLMYAYGFEVTNLSLEETRDERRQTSLVRVLRALAHPDIITYEKEEFDVSLPFYMDCPADGVPVIEVDTTQPYLVADPACGGPKDTVVLQGYNFEPETRGPINFIPPSGVKLQLGTAEINPTGYFSATIALPNRGPVEEAQEIRVTTRRNIGPPMWTDTARQTWDKIIETVFMALLATTFGTILAVPISFFAARNLMKEVTSPLASAALSIIGWPIGVFAGLEIVRLVNQLMTDLTTSTLLNITGAVVGAGLAWVIGRWSLPEEDRRTTTGVRLLRYFGTLVTVVLLALVVRLISNLAYIWGAKMVDSLGVFGFLGTFISNIGEITGLIVSAALVVGAGALVGSLGSRLGQVLFEKLPNTTAKLLNFPLGAAAGAVLAVILVRIADWFYQYNNPAITLWWPLAIGGGLGLLLALRAWQEDVITTGLAIYSVTRTLLNALRSIEALIMAIVFAVWVSIGPFAGVLALSLHTIASLAKLYSEQVESIMTGPLEAIRATGATRMQTIIYGVIPQIVPPYIAFTIYRWDINVRMSTIIGFAGGGGIGFLLQQNINILNYRAASAQMLAIAIVVASMDYISSLLRERII